MQALRTEYGSYMYTPVVNADACSPWCRSFANAERREVDPFSHLGELFVSTLCEWWYELIWMWENAPLIYYVNASNLLPVIDRCMYSLSAKSFRSKYGIQMVLGFFWCLVNNVIKLFKSQWTVAVRVVLCWQISRHGKQNNLSGMGHLILYVIVISIA